MRRWGGQSLKENYQRERTNKYGFRESWRERIDTEISLRRCVAICMVQEGWSAWTAFKAVRRYTIIHGHWPKPAQRREMGVT